MKRSLRMKFMLLLFALVVGSSNVWADETATFDFDTNAGTNFGITGTSSNSSTAGDITSNVSATINGVTVTITPSGGNTNNRFWNNSPKLRLYGGTMTISAGSNTINGISFSTASGKFSVSVDEGSTSGSGTSWSWSGSASTIVFSITGTTQIKSFTVTYGAPSNYISVSPTTKDITRTAQNVEFTITTDQSLAANPIVFYTTSAGTVTTTKPDWIGDLTSAYSSSTLTIPVNANTSVARTAYFKVEKGSVKSGVITINQAELPRLETPTLTVTAGNNKVTPTWSDIDNASSYTLVYDDNSEFSSSTSLENHTSGTAITGLTNGTTYYFKLQAIGDGTNYRSSEFSDVVSATPSNSVKITITYDKLKDFTNTYGWYDWSIGGIDGWAYSYKNSTNMQFNKSKDYYCLFNSSAVPGVITSVKMTSSAATDKKWKLYVTNSAYTKSSPNGGTYIDEKTVTSSGVTWDVDDNYPYFLLFVSESGASVISSIDITYVPKDYHVTFKANGGTGADNVYYYNEDETVTAVANPFTEPADCTFASWNTAADGSGTSYSANATFDMPDSNVTLYAQWNHALPVNGSGELTDDVIINVGETATATDLNIPDSYAIWVEGVLRVSGTLECANSENLVIFDGGQLFTTSSDVNATVYHSIEAATAKDATNWYAISSSVNSPALAYGNDATNLITTNATPHNYDLYRYNEEKNTSTPWENFRNNAYSTTFTSMENGRGYLYRNASDMDITYDGVINTSASYTVSVTGSGEFAGFNLMGNPYPHDIYKGAGTAIPNTVGASGYVLASGFYTLQADGTWLACNDNEVAIKSGQGFIVKATTGGAVAIGNTDAKSAKSNNDRIGFTVTNSQYKDVTYAIFEKGGGLNKIDHRNSEIPMLYINQKGEDYAIAMMDNEENTFNLCFKSQTMGWYTLSYNTKGEFDYLHIIDRVTGEDIDMIQNEEYSFISTPGDNVNRFIVQLSYQPGNYSIENNETFAYQCGNDIVVNGEGELQVFDVMGRMVATQHINGVQTINVPLRGVYIFRLNEKTQKIVVE